MKHTGIGPVITPRTRARARHILDNYYIGPSRQMFRTALARLETIQAQKRTFVHVTPDGSFGPIVTNAVP